MSIRWDTRNKRWRYEFDRYIQGRRHRLSRLLPRGWSQAQADAYDRTEGARLYALASGIQRADPLIDEAVAHYLRDKKASLKSFKATAENLAAIAWAYMGRPLSDLPAVARDVAQRTGGVRQGVTLSPATIRNRLAPGPLASRSPGASMCRRRRRGYLPTPPAREAEDRASWHRHEVPIRRPRL